MQLTETDLPPNQDVTDAFQDFINEAIANNETLELPSGTFRVGSLYIKESKGFQMYGHSMETTHIIGSIQDKPTIAAYGAWQQTHKNYRVVHQNVNRYGGVFEVDRIVEGPDATFGVQGNRFEKMCFDGRSLDDPINLHSAYAMTFGYHGHNYMQGDMEVLDGCYFYGGKEACSLNRGYNALNNKYDTCNFQSYYKHGVSVLNGSVLMLNCGFQANSQLAQPLNGGYDLWDIAGGAYETITAMNCRTESLQFYVGEAGHQPLIIGCVQRQAMPHWSANTEYTELEYPYPSYYIPSAARHGCFYGGKIWRCTETHTSSDTFDPAKFIEMPIKIVDVKHATMISNSFETGRTVQAGTLSPATIQVNQSYVVPVGMNVVFVDATNGPVTITIPDAREIMDSAELTIIKGDTSHNNVTVNSLYMQIDRTSQQLILTNRSGNRSVRFMAEGGGTLWDSWWRV